MNCKITLSLIQFLYDLQRKKIYLWLNNSGNLELFSESEVASDTLNKLKENKETIVKFLNSNNISAKPDYPLIYHCDLENNLYPLSYAQERLLFIDKFEQGTNVYNIPILFKLPKSLETKTLKKAFSLLIDTHNILRSVYTYRNNQFYQKVIDKKLLIPEKYIYSKEELDKNLNHFYNTVFDLENEFPIKIKLFYFNNFTYLAILFHHIAFDGWSTDIFYRDLINIYNSQVNNTSFIPVDIIQYTDFALWQKYYQADDLRSKTLEFWEKKLNNFEQLDFPLDKIRPSEFIYEGDYVNFTISEEKFHILKSIAHKQNTTLYNILLSAFYVLLHKYTQQNDLILGIPSANRNIPQLENLIGFFVNSLPIRIVINNEETIDSLVTKIKNSLFDSYKHQTVPFEKIVELLKLEKDVSRNPIFQIMFDYEKQIDLEDKNFQSINIENFFKIAKNDLTLVISETGNTLQGSFNFATSLFNKETIMRMVKHFNNILDYFISGHNTLIKNIKALEKEEYQKIIVDWNKKDKIFPRDKTIDQLFSDQISKTPDNLAIISESKNITYKQLDKYSNKIANFLNNKFKLNDSLIKCSTLNIGLYTGNCASMIIGLLGILKSGATYIPLDPKEPEERISHKVSDSNCSIILTLNELQDQLESNCSNNATVSYTIDDILKNQSSESLNDMIIEKSSSNIAYIIYTSGSTGKPKGVMIKHISLVNVILDRINEYQISQEEKVLLFNNYVFDASLEQIFISLLSGAALYIPNEETLLDTHLLEKYLLKNKITHLDVVPRFLDVITPRDDYSLKRIVVGGEACPKATIQKWTKLYKFYNNYGPTETTINATSAAYLKNEYVHNITIGKPISNYKAYILDSSLSPTPIGVFGTLYISGTGLAEGYLNNKELTEAKFINNPFYLPSDMSFDYEFMYNTGDKARWLPEGNIEFYGRVDGQIKLNGLRVELGEISSIIKEHSLISQCYIHAIDDLNFSTKKNLNCSTAKYLAAYYSLKDKFQDDNFNDETIEKKLKNFLSTKLPDFMIPAFFIEMNTIPLKNSGKVDVEQLPVPRNILPQNINEKPKDATEIKVRDLWQKTLNLESINVLDNFFHLGGTSMLAIKASHELSSNFNKHIPVAQIFLHPTVRKISEYINKELKIKNENENWEF